MKGGNRERYEGRRGAQRERRGRGEYPVMIRTLSPPSPPTVPSCVVVIICAASASSPLPAGERGAVR